MRILIIEKCLSYNYFLKAYLEKEYFIVETADTEEDGLLLARTHEYDLVILDTNFWEEMQSSVLLKQIRTLHPCIPLIILSPSCESNLAVAYLEAGADDFVAKPFCFQELTARIRAILRRPPIIVPKILSLDDLLLNPHSYEVTRGGQTISLTKKEFLLLEFFLRHPNTVFSREKIFEKVWDAHADTFSNTVETHIVSLRKKIEHPEKPRLLHTLPGKGYKMCLVTAPPAKQIP